MKYKYIGMILFIAGLQTTPVHAQQTLGAPPTAEAEIAAPNSAREAKDSPDGAHGFLAIGPGAIPAFDGAKRYRLIPLMIGNVGWKGVELQVRGLGARVDVLGDSPVQIGPIVNYRVKRNSSSDGSGRVKLLNDIDASLEVGGFIGYRFGGNQYGQGEVSVDLSLAKDVASGHEGLISYAQVSYAAYRSQKLFLNLDAQTSFADHKYMRTFFGVTPAEATRSGLSAYRPDGGIRDAGAGLTAGYQFDQKWGIIARAGVNYFLSDAKNSPVVDEGSKIQAVGGLALSYRF